MFACLGLNGQSYNLNNALHGSSLTTCSGTFYDSGGPNSRYSNNQNLTVTFCSDGGQNLKLDFTQFDVENGYDFLYIYNGPNTAAPQVSGSPFTGSGLPAPVTSSGTCLTVRFVSDHSVTRPGWAADISCVQADNTCGCGGNLLLNGGFEENDLSPWKTSPLAFSEFYTGHDACGNKSVRIKRNSGTGLVSPALWQQVNNIEPLKTYTLSFEAGTHDPALLHRVYLQFYNASGNLLSGDFLSINHDVDIDGKLKSYSLSVVAPAAAAFLRVEAALDGDWLMLDNCCLVQSSCSSPILNFQNPTLITGSPSSVGAKYKFANVLPGTDAIVTLTAKSHNNIVVFSIDEPAANYGGYDAAFQPMIDYNWILGGGQYDPPGEKSVTFKFDFVDATTNEPKQIPRINMTGIDIDGSTHEVREFMATSGFQAYETNTPTTLTLSGSLKAMGSLATEPGIDETALNAMISFVFENKSSVTVTYGGHWNGVTQGFGDSGPGNSDENRLNSLYFKCYDFNTANVCPAISISGSGQICEATTTILTASVSGATGSCSLQWQISQDGANWVNINGAVGESFQTPALSVLSHFRATYYCPGSASCGVVYSNVHTVEPVDCTAICLNGVDEDGDGVCAEDDCDDNNPNLPAPPGTACDDGNPNTSNDIIQPDGCTCAGTEDTPVSTTVTGGNCTGCDASMSVTFHGCNCVDIVSCKDLSNIVLGTANGAEIKYDNLSGKTASYCSPDGSPIVTVWVKSGCFLSGDGPGYGRRFDNPNNCGAPDDCEEQGGILPIASISGTNVVCAGNSTTLTASGGGTYLWNNGANAPSISVSPEESAVYAVTVTSANGCTATSEVEIFVHPAPVVTMSADAALCSGMSVPITASATGSGFYTYVWDNGLGAGSSKSVSPETSTAYRVTVTDANGCTGTGQVMVTVNQPPIANAGADQTICKFFSATLEASASGGTTPYGFTWSDGLGAGAIKGVAPLSSKTYTVTVTSANGCTGTDQVAVTVQPCPEICDNGTDDDGDGLTDCDDPDCGPSVSLDSNLTMCEGSSANLQASASGGNGSLSYAWSHGLGAGHSKTVFPAETTTYTVTVTASSGCAVTADVTVSVAPCTEDCTNGIDDDGDGLIDCDDPDCIGITVPLPVDDVYTTCPGLPFSERVTYNDKYLQQPTYNIAVQPTQGTVTIDWTGKFYYLPSNIECVTDVFYYQVCNQPSGCCATARVELRLRDEVPPVLTNVPADLTIGCDDAVPAPNVVTAFDGCPGVFVDYSEVSDQYSIGGCNSFTITRTWTASDFCGNEATGQQIITVQDQVAPEIFQVYTLENGKKLIAGVAKNVTTGWKYVSFPFTFNQLPVVFSQVTTDSDASAVVVQQRNGGTQGFEIRLSEEEASTSGQRAEDVAWLAIEPGAQSGGLALEAGTLANVNHLLKTLNFSQNYTAEPVFLASLLTTNDPDPVSIRIGELTESYVEMALQEETSADSEIGHGYETVGYIALEPGSALTDWKGHVFGETGRMQLTQAWATVQLEKSYSKPVVIAGGSSWKGADPVTVRVRNVTANSFEIHLEAWDYLGGGHPSETISWMVVEGSIPGDLGFYCAGKGNHLQPGINVFSQDNCDPNIHLEFNESSVLQPTGLLTTRTWTAVDQCGNSSEVTRLDTCSIPAIRAKALLFGAQIGSNNGNLMRDNLREKKLLPLKEPYSGLAAFPHVKDQMPNGLGPLVTICHQPGTPAQHTLEVPQVSLVGHLAHGDVIGSCEDLSLTGMVTICHQPGTPAQQTMTVPVASLIGHLQHGDLVGSCDGIENELPAGAATAQFKTIANGLWTDPAIWQGGQAPPTGNINNRTISITHNVTVDGSHLNLRSGSKLWLTYGSLTMLGGDFKIENGTAWFANSTFDGSATSNLLVVGNQSNLNITNCQVGVGKSFNNTNGKRRVENVFLTIGEHLENSGGTDSLFHVTATVGLGLTNKSGGEIYASETKFRLVNGTLQNALLSTFSGNDLVVLAENGSLLNLGSWSAGVSQYCVSNLVTIPLVNLLFPEDCSNILHHFDLGAWHGHDDEEGGENGPHSPGTVFGETVSGIMDPLLLQSVGQDAIVDWLVVELRSPGNEKDILAYSTVALQRDGTIVSENGDPLIVFPELPEGEYYVTVRHRNHLGLMTDEPWYLSIADPPTLDFSDYSLPVRGGNKAGKLFGGKRSLWAGDFNGDGKVIYQGPYNDIFYLFSRVLGDPDNTDVLANFIIESYDLHDLNLDGKVIYQGPNNDRASLLYHSVMSHPNNSTLLANFILTQSLP